MKRAMFIACVGFMTMCAPSEADILYRPVNPSFGGNPLNATHLHSSATAQKSFKEPQDSSTETSSERFLSMLQSRLYSSLASQVAEAIFGEDAQPAGTIVFDDQQISFVNTGTEIELIVTDFATGQVTRIVVPTLQ
jgi:curli production assembly/transport component CsgF